MACKAGVRIPSYTCFLRASVSFWVDWQSQLLVLRFYTFCWLPTPHGCCCLWCMTHVCVPRVGDEELMIGSSEGGLSVPALDIKQPTPVGERTPFSARSSNIKGEKRNSAGKRGETVCLRCPPWLTLHLFSGRLASSSWLLHGLGLCWGGCFILCLCFIMWSSLQTKIS